MSESTGTPGEEWIDRSIRETKLEHENREINIQDSRTVSKTKLEDWSVSDVIQWLECKDLHKFILLFQKHHVVGKDLAHLTLPFLDNYEHISVEERELLLSEIYLLHNPAIVHASEEDLTKITSPIDKKKYYAAIGIAQDKSASLPRSTSVMVLHNRGSSSSLASPKSKPRHKSESGTDNHGKFSKFEKNISDNKKRKTLPKMSGTDSHSIPVRPVYDYIQQYGVQCIHCVQLLPQQHGAVTMATDSQGHITIETVPESLRQQLHYGDRILEINGHIVTPHLKDPISHISAILSLKSPATIVVLTQHVSSGGPGEPEDKWTKLHTMLLEMRDSDPLPQVDIPDATTDQEHFLKHTNMLQDEIKKLEDKVKEQHKLWETLQLDLEDREASMHDLTISRDKAIEKLNQSNTRDKTRGSRQSLGGTEYYTAAMNSLNIDSASKEEVVDSLREIVKEASKQKWYLDRLISLIIEESPWLLDEVDTEFDNLTLTDQSEVFC